MQSNKRQNESFQEFTPCTLFQNSENRKHPKGFSIGQVQTTSLEDASSWKANYSSLSKHVIEFTWNLRSFLYSSLLLVT